MDEKTCNLGTVSAKGEYRERSNFLLQSISFDVKYAWPPIGGPSIELANKGQHGTKYNIYLPLQSTAPLHNQRNLHNFKHNFIRNASTTVEHFHNIGLFAAAAGVMAVHELLVYVYNACPLPMLVWDSETGMFQFGTIADFISCFKGKSSAARCALSLCGEWDSGHLMKTKSISDSICIERCCKSTLPFVLDDPKSLEVVSELLIDLCNGRLMGNLKVVLRKPRFIRCNFSDTKHHRYSKSLCH